MRKMGNFYNHLARGARFTPDGEGRKLTLSYFGPIMRGFTPILGQCNENIALGHRSDVQMSSLISPLKGIVNAFLNG